MEDMPAFENHSFLFVKGLNADRARILQIVIEEGFKGFSFFFVEFTIVDGLLDRIVS